MSGSRGVNSAVTRDEVYNSVHLPAFPGQENFLVQTPKAARAAFLLHFLPPPTRFGQVFHVPPRYSSVLAWLAESNGSLLLERDLLLISSHLTHGSDVASTSWGPIGKVS